MDPAFGLLLQPSRLNIRVSQWTEAGGLPALDDLQRAFGTSHRICRSLYQEADRQAGHDEEAERQDQTTWYLQRCTRSSFGRPSAPMVAQRTTVSW